MGLGRFMIRAKRALSPLSGGSKSKHGTHNLLLDRLNLWALAVQCKPAKGRSDDSGSAASPMIKLTKYGKEEEENTHSWNCFPSPRGVSP